MRGTDRLAAVLPALDRWDLRRIDGAVTFDTVAGGAAGYLIGGSVGIPLAFLASMVRRLLGYPWGHVAKAAGFLVAAYCLAVFAANWSETDS